MSCRRLGILTVQVLGFALLIVVAFVLAHYAHVGMTFALGGHVQSTLTGWVVSGTLLLCGFGGAFRSKDDGEEERR